MKTKCCSDLIGSSPSYMHDYIKNPTDKISEKSQNYPRVRKKARYSCSFLFLMVTWLYDFRRFLNFVTFEIVEAIAILREL